MANGVKFLRGLYEHYNSLVTKDTDTLYITGASQGSYDSIYLGANMLGTSTPDAASIKFTPSTYPTDTTITEIDEQTTLLGLIKVLENRMTDIAGGSHSVLSVAGLTGEIQINNTTPTEEEFANLGNGDVYVLPSTDTKTLLFRTNIDAAGLFSPTQLVKNDGTEDVDVTYDDLLQIVDAGQVLNSIHLAKLKLRLCNSTQEQSSDPEQPSDSFSYVSDGLVLMSDVSAYIRRVLYDYVGTSIESHKNESDAHALKNISSVDEEIGQNMSNTITLSTGDWAFTHKILGEDITTLADNLKTAGDAQELTQALFDVITASLTANKGYTDALITSVAIEWGEIA